VDTGYANLGFYASVANRGLPGSPPVRVCSTPYPDSAGGRIGFFGVVASSPSAKRKAMIHTPSRAFVGRKAELAFFAERARATRDGGSAVFVVGERGIGKSRLIAQAFAQAPGCAPRVAREQCLRHGRRPFGLLCDILRDVGSTVPRSGGDAPALDVARVWRAVETWAARDGGILIIDDLQWADPYTLEFVEYAAARVAGARLLLVCSLRSAELRPGKPVAELVLWARHACRAWLLELTPLSPQETSELARSIASGASHTAEALGRLETLSEGNPLVVAELAEAPESQSVPQPLRVLARELLADLDGVERELLAAASAFGARFSAEDLACVSAEPAEAVSAMLRRARSRGIVVDIGNDGEMAFSHAFVREALHADLLRADAERLRGAIEALRAGDDPRGAGRVVALRDGARSKPLPFGFSSIVSAARGLALRGAADEALELAGRAEAMLGAHRPRGDVEVHEVRAIAYGWRGDVDAALAAAADGVAAARRSADATLATRASTTLATVAVALGRLDAAAAAAERAVALARDERVPERLLGFALLAAAECDAFAGQLSMAAARVRDAARLAARIEAAHPHEALRLRGHVAMWALRIGLRLEQRTLMDLGDIGAAFADARRSNDARYLARVASAYAELRLVEGARDEARGILATALAGTRLIGLAPDLALVTAAAGSTLQITDARRRLSRWAAGSCNALGPATLALFDAVAGNAPDASALLEAARAFENAGLRFQEAIAFEHAGQSGAAAAVFREIGSVFDLRRMRAAGLVGVGAEPLSRRELDVLDQIAKGRSNRAIADVLGISERTVESHLRSIYAKLGVTSRLELATSFAASEHASRRRA
jgi:DNA-binding CsgD family transcriptional regulator